MTDHTSAARRFAFEIQLGWFPGCGWLRSPYPRDTWERAFEEARAYAENAQRYHGVVCAIRVVDLG